MKINFRGTRIPIETNTSVWGKKIPYTEIVVKNDSDVNEKFLQEQFVPHLQKAIKILGNDNRTVTEIAQKGTEENKLQIKKLVNVVINFDTDYVYYDYYFDVGKLFGCFVVHFKGTPEGNLEYIGIS